MRRSGERVMEGRNACLPPVQHLPIGWRMIVDPASPTETGVESGELVPLTQVVRRVLPRMWSFQYLGAEFDEAILAYRLKFSRRVQILWLDFDARSGRLIEQSRLLAIASGADRQGGAHALRRSGSLRRER